MQIKKRHRETFLILGPFLALAAIVLWFWEPKRKVPAAPNAGKTDTVGAPASPYGWSGNKDRPATTSVPTAPTYNIPADPIPDAPGYVTGDFNPDANPPIGDMKDYGESGTPGYVTGDFMN